MAVGMKDIAKKLGLSIVTVSKVLDKNDSAISEATRKRAFWNPRTRRTYRSNPAAKSVVTGQSKISV